MIALAAVLTFALTTVMAMTGVGAAFVLIPVFLALGVELHVAMATALLLNAVAMTVASVTFVCKRLVVWPLVLPMLALAVIASPFGVRLAPDRRQRTEEGVVVHSDVELGNQSWSSGCGGSERRLM